MEPGGPASGTLEQGLRTSKTILTPTSFFILHLTSMLTPALCCRYLTLRNGGIALAQAHIASLIIFVSQCGNPFTSILCLTSSKYAQALKLTKRGRFCEGSSIFATTMLATPSATLRSAGHIQQQQQEQQDDLQKIISILMQGPLLLHHPHPLPLCHLLLHPRLVTSQVSYTTLPKFTIQLPPCQMLFELQLSFVQVGDS